MTEPTTIEPLDLRFQDDELDDVVAHLTDFIERTVEDAGADRAVLGLSGGIDSSAVAYLAVEALGTEALHGLVLPGAVSDEANMSDAERVAEDLGIEYDVVEIDPFVEQLVELFPDIESDQLAVGNARARTRAVINYFVANHEDALVLGTGNRSEALVGYFTKYGDGAVDCNPLGRLYKQQVRQLGRHLGVPAGIAAKKSTAGLWAGQTDEEELGIDYDTLDAVLALHVDGEVSPAATARILDIDRETVERVGTMYRQSAHKRSMPPTPDPLF